MDLEPLYEAGVDEFDHHWARSVRHARVFTAPAAPLMDIKCLLHSTVHLPATLQLVEDDQAAVATTAAAVETDAIASMEPITAPQPPATVPKGQGGAASGTPMTWSMNLIMTRRVCWIRRLIRKRAIGSG